MSSRIKGDLISIWLPYSPQRIRLCHPSIEFAGWFYPVRRHHATIKNSKMAGSFLHGSSDDFCFGTLVKSRCFARCASLWVTKLRLSSVSFAGIVTSEETSPILSHASKKARQLRQGVQHSQLCEKRSTHEDAIGRPQGLVIRPLDQDGAVPFHKQRANASISRFFRFLREVPITQYR